MASMKKWNERAKTYEPYSVPEDWHTPIFTANIDEVVNCAQCGKVMTFGDGYTSHFIHTESGLGYSVCMNCYEKERGLC